MTELYQEFLGIVRQIRTHLEYQRALGLRHIETVASAPETVPERTAAISGGRPEMPRPAEPGRDLEEVRKELGDCVRCKLQKERKTIVFGEGNPRAVLLFVGEGPGQEEDEQGRPFVGAAGQLLTDIIVKGMKIEREDVYICNIVKCRPPGNRSPEQDELDACEPFLEKQIAAVNPAVIVALGNTAAKTLLRTGEGITALRGRWREYRGIPLMPTFHPAYLLRNPKDKKLVWEDIQKVMARLNMPVSR